MTNRSLVLLSGEGTSIPQAESRALFLTYDPSAKFTSPEPRVLIVESNADPFVVGSRVAFARRVGRLVASMEEAEPLLKGGSARFRNLDTVQGLPSPDPARLLGGLDITVDLKSPGREITLVRGRGEYLAVTDPGSMRQGWASRRPRRRPFFHPSAIFPKLSRALVNLSRCTEGGRFLDPFAGTGSLALEAAVVGADVVAVDRSRAMAAGSLSNMAHFGQRWLGVVRADSFSLPVEAVDAVATDVPYGRASSTLGREGGDLLHDFVELLPGILKRGSRAVVMHPKGREVQDHSDLVLEEEHDLYVHKLLTRTISVFRRR